VLPGQPELQLNERTRFGFDARKLLWFNEEGERVAA
jgi:hypothetical protein